jgi:RecA/RadA recombinase
MHELPSVVKEINKKAKATRITTLARAKALYLKRFYSGSYAINTITGGGYAYRRIHILFGGKSAGKNASLNQMIAHNQRICRHCHGILPQYYEQPDNSIDRWTLNLKYIQGMPMCMCKESTGRKFLFLDYEKSLALEEARVVTLSRIMSKKTGKDIDELDVNDCKAELELLRAKESLEDEDKARIKEIESFLSDVVVETHDIIQEATTDYLIKCGVLPDELLISDPEDTEEGIEIVRETLRSGEMDGIIWDSLQAAVPRYVSNREADQATMGIEAKQNGLLMRHICSAFSAKDLEDEKEAYKAAMFITSQIRSSIGGFIAAPDTYSGGKAVEHHNSLALEVKREFFLKSDGRKAEFKEDYYGQNVRLRPDKNKLSAPGGAKFFNYYFKSGEHHEVGIDYVDEIVNLAVEAKIIDRAGAYYKFKDESFQGMEKLLTYMNENSEFIGEIYKELKNKI